MELRNYEIFSYGDSIKIDYVLRMPWGIRDKEESRIINHSDLEKLRELPEIYHKANLRSDIKVVDHPLNGNTVSFVFRQFMESGSCNEQGFVGVYRRE